MFVSFKIGNFNIIKPYYHCNHKKVQKMVTQTNDTTRKGLMTKHFQSLKKNSVRRTVDFYNNPETQKNNYDILLKIAAIEEMSVNELINEMIEEQRKKYFPVKKSSL